MHMYLHFFILLYWTVWCFSVCSILSLFLLLVALWHLNENLLRPETFFIPGHLLLIRAFFMSGSVIIKPVRTFPRTFLGVAFTQNARSFFLTSPILIFPLLFTIRIRGPFVISRSAVSPWSYRNFTTICTDLILPYLAFSFLFEVYV